MNNIIVLVCLMWHIVLNVGNTIPSIAEKFLVETLEPCRNQYGASDHDVWSYINNQKPNTRSGKCMVHCFLNQYEWITDRDDGYGLSATNIENFFRLQDLPEEKIEVKHDIAKACENIRDDDHCELAGKLLDCWDLEHKKRGISSGHEFFTDFP